MTTVPLSVCYGALNILVLADTSNFVPYVCDRAIAGGVRRAGKHRTVVRYPSHEERVCTGKEKGADCVRHHGEVIDAKIRQLRRRGLP